MGFRFWRRLKIAPGLTLNLSKSGGSLSFGPRGAKFTVGPRGARATVGLPGTGLFYTMTGATNKQKPRKRETTAPPMPQVSPADRLSMGFFKRLITPKEEEALVDGCRELVLGNEDKALSHLKRSVHLADGAFLAGFLALKHGQVDMAVKSLRTAADNSRRLGRYVGKYGIDAVLSLPITDEVSAHVGLTLRGALLGLVEAHQQKKQWQDAADCLNRLLRIEPDDVVVKLSLAEVLLDARPHDKAACKKVARLTEGATNETPIHAALLLYKAKALRELGLPDAARETLTRALRRKKDRPDDLLHALRYERALVYEDLGQARRARSEWEKLYADAPEYEDVAQRVGLG